MFVHPSGDCTEDGATLVGDASPATYTVTDADVASGSVTFACDVGSHCESGMILTFMVDSTSDPAVPGGDGSEEACANEAAACTGDSECAALGMPMMASMMSGQQPPAELVALCTANALCAPLMGCLTGGGPPGGDDMAVFPVGDTAACEECLAACYPCRGLTWECSQTPGCPAEQAATRTT